MHRIALGSRRLVPALFAFLLFMLSAEALRGQSVELAGLRLETPRYPARADAFGTSSSTIIQVPAAACAPVFGTISQVGLDGYVYSSGSAAFWDCAVNPPSGAKLVQLELVAFDGSDAGSVVALAAHCPDVAVGPPCLGAGPATTTGTSTAPFTGRVFFDLTPYDLIVDKSAELYFVRVSTSSAVPALRFREIDLFYRLQVSTPAPGTQTFADVPPSFLYWKAIEALAASGITGGCGGGNFCPNQNVTRGEIAAFFARALGLNFPN